MGLYAFAITFHGSRLVADLSGAVLHSTRDLSDDEHIPVYLYAQKVDSSVFYLLADGARVQNLRVPPQCIFGPIVPLRATRMDRSGSLSFYSPEGGAFLCAAEVDVQTRNGHLALAANLPREYEHFRFDPIHESRVPANVRELAHIIDGLGEPRGSAQRVVDLVKKSPAQLGVVLNAFGMLLSESDLREIVERILTQSEEIVPLWKALFGNDLYGFDALPGVVEWLKRSNVPSNAVSDGPALQNNADPASQSRVSRPPLHLSEGYDQLDAIGLDGRYLSLSYALNHQARRMARPRQGACVVTSARDEGIYILEWIAHHRVVGFEHIFLYSNDNSDGSDELLHLLHEAGIITWVSSSVGTGRRAQWKAYGHALRVMPETLDYEWSLFIDLDEFFTPSPIFGSVTRFLEWHDTRSVDVIGINWLMVGSNGETVWRDAPLMQRFPYAIKGANQHIKSLFRTRKFLHSYPHDPASVREEPVVFRNSLGQEHVFNPKVSRGISLNPDIAMASVVHFFFKSNEEYIWKTARNRGDHFRIAEADFPDWNKNLLRVHIATSRQVEVETGLSYLAEPVQREMARLSEIPGVQQAVERVKSAYRQKIGALVEKACAHPVISELGDEGMQFLSPLLSSSPAGAGEG